MSSTTAVCERPILFSGPMVRAILDGRKTQTRRVVKGEWARDLDACSVPTTLTQLPARLRQAACCCPYGQSGDRLWVRETLRRDNGWRYAADGAKALWSDRHARPSKVVEWYDNYEFAKLCVSIHMPRWASRLTLEITNVRVERLQEITEADAVAEGYESRAAFLAGDWAAPLVAANPWVWVWAISFRRVTP